MEITMMKKRVFVLLLAAVVLFAASAAGALTLPELMQAAQAGMAEAKSYELKLTANVSMSALGESMEMKTIMNIKYLGDPLIMKMTGTVNSTDGKSKIEEYLRAEDEYMAVYTVEKGGVSKSKYSLSADPLQMVGLPSRNYLDDYKNFKYEGTAKLGGKTVYVVSAKLNFKEANDQLANQYTGLSSVMGTLKFNGDIDVSVKMYIDPKTMLMVRQEIDMAEMMKEVFRQFGELVGDTGTDFVDIDIKQYTMTFDFKNINKVKKFSIPSSVIKKAS